MRGRLAGIYKYEAVGFAADYKMIIESQRLLKYDLYSITSSAARAFKIDKLLGEINKTLDDGN